MDKDHAVPAPVDPQAAAETAAPITVAWLAAEAATAQDLADLLAERLDSASAVAAYEDGSLWRVEIQFATPPRGEDASRRELADIVGEDTARAFRFEALPARDWVAASLAGLEPVAAGRFVVHGAHDRARIAANRIGIEIEASLAFGTGHHATTRGCLLALDRLLKARCGRGSRGAALDVGTGSGVLAIAAAKAMRTRVIASDVDPVAAGIARDNMRRNGAAPLVEVICADGLGRGRFRRAAPYALVFANILLEPLRRLAGPIARLAGPRATIVLSGLLAAQDHAALARYQAHGMRLVRRITIDGWATLVMTRDARKRRRLNRVGARGVSRRS